MKQYQQVFCPNCESDDLVKNGHRENGTQRYRCKSCSKSFQTDYTYNAWKPGVKDQIDEQTRNSSGVRDIGRNLKMAKGTVISHLKKKVQDVNPYLLDWLESQSLESLEVEFYYSTEWDEFWSFVQNKSNIRWTWYLIDKRSGIIIAWQNGRRTDELLKKFLAKVAHLPLFICHTEKLGAYQRLFPKEYLHLIGKDNTWKIERKNLNFRTHLKRLSRRTICFSKNEMIHDNVIGMYIERYYFKSGQFAHAA